MFPRLSPVRQHIINIRPPSPTNLNSNFGVAPNNSSNPSYRPPEHSSGPRMLSSIASSIKSFVTQNPKKITFICGEIIAIIPPIVTYSIFGGSIITISVASIPIYGFMLISFALITLLTCLFASKFTSSPNQAIAQNQNINDLNPLNGALSDDNLPLPIENSVAIQFSTSIQQDLEQQNEIDYQIDTLQQPPVQSNAMQIAKLRTLRFPIVKNGLKLIILEVSEIDNPNFSNKIINLNRSIIIDLSKAPFIVLFQNFSEMQNSRCYYSFQGYSRPYNISLSKLDSERYFAYFKRNIYLSQAKHHPFAQKNSHKWVQIGKSILQKIYQTESDELEIDLSEGTYPKLPEGLSNIKGLMTGLGIFDKKKREELIRQEGEILRSFLDNLTEVSKTLTTAATDANRIMQSYFRLTDDMENRYQTYLEERQDYLAAILCITWAIYDHAAAQQNEVTRGSYKITDTDKKLYKFLLNYIKFATRYEDPRNVHAYGILGLQKFGSILDIFFQAAKCDIPKVKEKILGLVTNGASPFGYSRTPDTAFPGSSHYRGHRDQFGIDLRFRGDEWALNLCPNKGTHLLFGDVGLGEEEDLLFFKVEEEGLGNTIEALSHTVSFANSGHNLEGSRREKDNYLLAHYEKYCAAAKIKYDNKKPIYKIYKEMLESSMNLNAHQYKMAFIQAAINLGYNIDTLHIRSGNEVILNLHIDFPIIKKTQEDGFVLV